MSVRSREPCMRSVREHSLHAARLAAFSLVLSGCAATAEPAQSVTGGHKHYDKSHPEVGVLLTDTWRNKELRRCTATLISPSVVLTAAHCLRCARRPALATEVLRLPPSSEGGVARVVPVRRFWSLPDSCEEGTIPIDDVGLVELAEEVPIPPAKLADGGHTTAGYRCRSTEQIETSAGFSATGTSSRPTASALVH